MHRRDFMRTSAHLALSAGFIRQSSLLRHEPDQLMRPWTDEVVTASADRMQWWREARFGMFVHWGLYAILAGEWEGKTNYGEWIRNNAKIPLETYNRLLERWNPRDFDADGLARMAKAAGMRYLVITTKHHDGFALWPSAHGDFNVARTGVSRDIMREVSDACRRHGVVPCWYHSIMDWHHPDYLPRRDWEAAARPATGASFDRYVQFLHAQVEELLTHYGDMGVMWFDGEWESTWTRDLGAALAEKCRHLQANVIVNNRVAPNRAGMLDAKVGGIGDFGTPEQNIPDRGLPGVDWEACMTMNQNWGYNRADHDFKSLATLVGMVSDTASKGGNLLLNVGPMASGALPTESIDRLQRLATWMAVHGEAIHGTMASPFEGAPFRATRKAVGRGGEALHVFLPQWPASRELLLPGLRTVPTQATLFGQRTRNLLPVRAVDAGVVVTLPPQATDPTCSVLRLQAPTPFRVG